MYVTEKEMKNITKDSTTENLSIMLVENHAVLKDSLVDYLNANLNDVHLISVDSYGDAIFMATSADPEIVILDIHISLEEGHTAIRKIKRLKPTIKMIILTTYDIMEFNDSIEGAGANAVILK
ncbi:response regulator, partial [Elusimicrobiota bacterium]